MTPVRRQQGFVLVVTLWFVAMLALVAAVITGWVTRSLAGGAALAARVEARRQSLGAVDEVAFLVSTNFFSFRGLEMLGGEDWTQAAAVQLPYVLSGGHTGFIALDNRPYRLADGTVQLQDTRGLYNLLFADRAVLNALLRTYGVPFEDRPGLWDRLKDYVGFGLADGDAPAYAAAGQPPPRVAPLLSPWEIRRVLGWQYETGLWQNEDSFPEVATVSQMGGLNPNTAPVRLLRALPGMTEEAVGRVLRYRETRPITSDLEFEAASGVAGAIDPMHTLFYPADTLRLEVALPGEPLTWVVALSKTVMGPAPYRIDYAYARPRFAPLPDAATIAALPPFPAGPAP